MSKTTIREAIAEHNGRACFVPGCAVPADRISLTCRRHKERQRHQGHPVLRAQSARVRRRTIRLVRKNIDPFVTGEVVSWVEGLQDQLSKWERRMPRELDSRICSYLSHADPVDFLSAAVAFGLNERRRGANEDPVPQWTALHPKRRQRFLGCQLGIYLRHCMTQSPGGNSRHRRATARISHLLLQYRSASTTMLPVISRLACLVEPPVAKELTAEIQAQVARDRAKAERAKRERLPWGINPDGSFDIYRTAKDTRE